MADGLDLPAGLLQYFCAEVRNERANFHNFCREVTERKSGFCGFRIDKGDTKPLEKQLRSHGRLDF